MSGYYRASALGAVHMKLEADPNFPAPLFVASVSGKNVGMLLIMSRSQLEADFRVDTKDEIISNPSTFGPLQLTLSVSRILNIIQMSIFSSFVAKGIGRIYSKRTWALYLVYFLNPVYAHSILLQLITDKGNLNS